MLGNSFSIFSFLVSVDFLDFLVAFFLGAALGAGSGVLTALFEPPQAEPQPDRWAKTVPPDASRPATVIPARICFSLSVFI